MATVLIGSSHVARLQQYVGRHCRGGVRSIPDLHFLGRSGLTAARLADLNDDLTEYYRRELVRIQPIRVILLIGSNDLDQLSLGPPEVAVAEVMRRLRGIVSWIQLLTTQILLMQLLPRVYPRTSKCTFRYKYPGRADYFILRVLVNRQMMGLPVARVSPSLTSLLSCLQPDCVHLSDAGNQRLLKRMITSLKRM